MHPPLGPHLTLWTSLAALSPKRDTLGVRSFLTGIVGGRTIESGTQVLSLSLVSAANLKNCPSFAPFCFPINLKAFSALRRGSSLQLPFLLFGTKFRASCPSSSFPLLLPWPPLIQPSSLRLQQNVCHPYNQ